MPLDNPGFPSQINPSNPQNGDSAGQGAAHIRKISAVLKNAFPEIAGTVTLTHDEINALPGDIVAESEARESADTDILDQLDDTNNSLKELKTAFEAFKAAYDERDIAVEVMKKTFPIGAPFISFSDRRNPADILGFGTWVEECQGRVVIGAGESTDSRGETETFAAGATGGAFKHQLTVDELPKHRLRLESPWRRDSRGPWYGNNDQGISHSGWQNGSSVFTDYVGSDSPHSIMQPYKTAYVWRRTA